MGVRAEFCERDVFLSAAVDHDGYGIFGGQDGRSVAIAWMAQADGGVGYGADIEVAIGNELARYPGEFCEYETFVKFGHFLLFFCLLFVVACWSVSAVVSAAGSCGT